MLTNSLMKLYPTHSLYVMDFKLRDFNNYPGIYQGDELPPKRLNNQRVQVWQPLSINPEVVERWLFRIRHDAPAILQIDELLALSYKKGLSSPEFTTITKLGRALPIITIAQTQELVEIPRGALSQPDHIVRFRLKMPYERRLMDNMLGATEEEGLSEPAEPWGFWYGHAEIDAPPIYYDSAQTFLGLNKQRRL